MKDPRHLYIQMIFEEHGNVLPQIRAEKPKCHLYIQISCGRDGNYTFEVSHVGESGSIAFNQHTGPLPEFPYYTRPSTLGSDLSREGSTSLFLNLVCHLSHMK